MKSRLFFSSVLSLQLFQTLYEHWAFCFSFWLMCWDALDSLWWPIKFLEIPWFPSSFIFFISSHVLFPEVIFRFVTYLYFPSLPLPCLKNFHGLDCYNVGVQWPLSIKELGVSFMLSQILMLVRLEVFTDYKGNEAWITTMLFSGFCCPKILWELKH